MGIDQIRALVIEDDPEVFRLIRDSLAAGSLLHIDLTHADQLSSALQWIQRQEFDVVLADLRLPDCGGTDVLSALRSEAPELPIVLLGEAAGDVPVRDAYDCGRADYLSKDEIDGPTLRRVLHNAIERKRATKGISCRDMEQPEAERTLRCRAKELAALQDTVLEITAPHDLASLLETIVERAASLLSAPAGSLFLCDADREEVRCVVSYNTDYDFTGTVVKFGEGVAGTVAGTGQPLIVDDYDTWNGRAAVFDRGLPFTTMLGAPMVWQNRVIGVILVLHHMEGWGFTEADVELLTLFGNHAAIAVENARLYDEAKRELAQRRQAEEALQHSEEHFRALIENAMDLIGIFEADATIRYFSPSLERVLGYKPEEIVGRCAMDFVHPDDVSAVADHFSSVQTGAMGRIEMRLRHKDGSWRALEGSGTDLRHHPAVAGIVINARDVSERRKLEEQLHQTQKMEALRRLAGGVCHDFNNLLTVIMGRASLLLRDFPQDDPRHEAVVAIREAANTAAESTHQLLAFSRRQDLQPRILNLNDVIAETMDALHDRVGEQIDVRTALTPDLGLVEADPEGLEQVISSLVAHACDEMPQGGRLVVETANVDLDGLYASEHPDVEPGRYVRLAVSDTGRGMDPKTLSCAFEPFSTTIDRDAGLRLPTVYGIIKQSGGHVSLYSEVGCGTVFKIYLPRVAELSAAQPVKPDPSAPTGGNETILLVEDDSAVREVMRHCLSELGYAVLEASRGVEAVDLDSDPPRPGTSSVVRRHHA